MTTVLHTGETGELTPESFKAWKSRNRQKAIAVDLVGQGNQTVTVIVDSCKEFRSLPAGRHEGTLLERVRLSSKLKEGVPTGGEIWRAIPDPAKHEAFSHAVDSAK